MFSHQSQTKVAALSALGFLTLVTIFGTNSFAQATTSDTSKCFKIRGAFDIGSETTKMKVFKINTCTGKIVGKALFPSTKEDKDKIKSLGKQLAFQIDMDQVTKDAKEKGQYNDDDYPQFSGPMLTKAARIIKQMKDMADTAMAGTKISDYIGVATEAFRQSNNSNFLIDSIEKSGVKMMIPAQQQEALIEWMGTTASVQDKDSDNNEVSPKNTVSWGIGGGSMQFGLKLRDGNFGAFSSKLASIHMHDKALLTLMPDADSANTDDSATANLLDRGLTKENINTLVKIAAKEANRAPDDFKDRIQDTKIVVYGVGGVINNSLAAFLKLHGNAHRSFNANDVKSALDSLTNDGQKVLKFDDPIFFVDPTDPDAANLKQYEVVDHKYQELLPTNLALILGVMQQLAIDRVYFMDIDNTYGAPFTADFNIKMVYKKPTPKPRPVATSGGNLSKKVAADDAVAQPTSAAVKIETNTNASADNSAICEAFTHTYSPDHKVCYVDYEVPSKDWCTGGIVTIKGVKACKVNGNPVLIYKTQQ